MKCNLFNKWNVVDKWNVLDNKGNVVEKHEMKCCW